MNKELKIVGLVDGKGSRYHRVQLPLQYLEGKKVFKGGEEYNIKTSIIQKNAENFYLLENDIKDCDILWLGYTVNNKDVIISSWREKYGFFIFQDVDDYWGLHESHIMKGEVDYETKMIFQCSNADLVIVTNKELADLASNYNHRVSIVPNCLPYGEGQFNSDKIESDKIRIGLVGSISHYSDWLMLRNVIKKITSDKEIKEKCQFVLGGYVKGNKHWEEIKRMFTYNKGVDLKLIEAKPVTEYMDIYKEVDILLHPLEKNTFNICKSTLKTSEAACKNIPVITNSFYANKQGSASCLVENIGDWYKWIKELINRDYKELGEKFAQENKEELPFDLRIERYKNLIEFYINEYDKEELKPKGLNIWSIVYKNGQSSEYPIYDNSNIRTIEQKSYLFEWNPIIDIIDNKVSELGEDEFIGIFSYKFGLKTNIIKRMLYNHLNTFDISEYDCHSLCQNYFNNNYLAFTENVHNGFMEIFEPLCKDLGLECKEPSKVIYSNFFIMKKKYYVQFVNTVIKPAIEILETKYKDLVWRDAKYTSGLKREILKEFTGLEYYPMFPFVLERLVSIWLENNPEIKFKSL